MVTIKQVSTKKELKQFIRFNYELYKDNPYSVPDLYEDMLNTFSDKNAAMEFCEAAYFLAYKDDKVVGRVAAIINNKANKTWNLNNVRFGWIDFIDDEEVSKALIDTVEKWGKERGMDTIQGPLGFTDMDAEGMLIEGFEELSTMATIYNYPYYQKHMEKLGFEKDADWIEMLMTVPKETGMPERLSRIAEIVMKKIDHYVKMYLPMLDLKLVSLITEANGRLVAVGISMPSMSRALQKAKGKLTPLGWWHLLKALKFKKPKTLDLLLVGVLPEYQSKGVNSILFYDLLPIYISEGYDYVETNPELEDNSKVQQQWIYFERRQHKRRRCYKKALK